MRLSLEIVVIIIVLLIVALVVLTIFGVTVTQIRTVTEARRTCTSLAENTCASVNNLPTGWNVPSYNVEGVMRSCRDLLPGCGCSEHRFVC